MPCEASENEQVKKSANEANAPTPAIQRSAQGAATVSRSAPAPSQAVAPSSDPKMETGKSAVLSESASAAFASYNQSLRQ